MKESLRHIRDTNRVIASSELFLGNKDCPALAIHLAYHIECLPYKSKYPLHIIQIECVQIYHGDGGKR